LNIFPPIKGFSLIMVFARPVLKLEPFFSAPYARVSLCTHFGIYQRTTTVAVSQLTSGAGIIAPGTNNNTTRFFTTTDRSVRLPVNRAWNQA